MFDCSNLRATAVALTWGPGAWAGYALLCWHAMAQAWMFGRMAPCAWRPAHAMAGGPQFPWYRAHLRLAWRHEWLPPDCVDWPRPWRLAPVACIRPAHPRA